MAGMSGKDISLAIEDPSPQPPNTHTLFFSVTLSITMSKLFFDKWLFLFPVQKRCNMPLICFLIKLTSFEDLQIITQGIIILVKNTEIHSDNTYGISINFPMNFFSVLFSLLSLLDNLTSVWACLIYSWLLEWARSQGNAVGERSDLYCDS